MRTVAAAGGDRAGRSRRPGRRRAGGRRRRRLGAGAAGPDGGGDARLGRGPGTTSGPRRCCAAGRTSMGRGRPDRPRPGRAGMRSAGMRLPRTLGPPADLEAPSLLKESPCLSPPTARCATPPSTSGCGVVGTGEDRAVLRLGITDYAQSALGDIVFVTLARGQARSFTAGQALGEVESTKSVSDVYAPVARHRHAARNEALESEPRAAQQRPARGGLDRRALARRTVSRPR